MKWNQTVGLPRRSRSAAAVALALSLPFILTTATDAQGREAEGKPQKETTEFELTAVRGIGLGEVSRGIDDASWEGSLYAGWKVRESPFSLGARLTMNNFGSEHNADLAGFSNAVPAEVRYSYNLLLTHLVLRYQPQPSVFRPYLETSVGLSYFFTQAYSGSGSVVPLVVGDAILAIEEGGSETLMSSLAPSLGVGGGVKVHLARIGRERSPLSVCLNLQGRYVYSGTASYLKPGGLVLDAGRLISRPQRSQTNWFDPASSPRPRGWS